MVYDALLFLSFGGPEGADDVMPFLRNVTRGRNVPEERLEAVAQHYQLFGGVSPINRQNRALIKALERALSEAGISLPVYWGNRNWHPLIGKALEQMVNDGIKRAVVFVTSAFGSFPACRMYLNDLDEAARRFGARAPVLHKLPLFYDHPLFITANADNLSKVLVGAGDGPEIIFTAHSIPEATAVACSYAEQLERCCRLVCRQLEIEQYALVYQSRSGDPRQRWLEPDICDYLARRAFQGVKNVIVHPIGFITDHMEIIYDLDVEASQVCQSLGVKFNRSSTAGGHPAFVQMIVELVQMYVQNPKADDFSACAADCCPPA